MSDDLLALSPLDGRYLAETRGLRKYFSEFAYLQGRVRVEIDYLIALSRDAHAIRGLSTAELDLLAAIAASFSLEDAHQSKDIEQTVRHDVKAVESFLRTKLASTSLSDISRFIHLGLTSEDVNNIAQSIALRDSRDEVLLPALEGILDQIASLVEAHKSTPMLARTHGQPAVPTTFGKEMAVFFTRLHKQRARLRSHRFEAKLTGAVGNFNALATALPSTDWLSFSGNFIHRLGLEPDLVTTQTLPYDNWIEYFQTLHRVNSILIDFAQDLWQYTSRAVLRLKIVASEVGSSTMPQKVNPIDFENAEGNLGVANALLEQYGRKLPISRLQRDLSDSTVRRTFGEALGHSLVAYASLRTGLQRVEANPEAMAAELEDHWEVVAEAAQTILRAAGVGEAYDVLKTMARGREISAEAFRDWIESLSVPLEVKEKLRGLSPLTYVGLAGEIAARSLAGRQEPGDSPPR